MLKIRVKLPLNDNSDKKCVFVEKYMYLCNCFSRVHYII